MELGPHVGVFVRGAVHPESVQPASMTVDFIAGDQATEKANVAGKASYLPYEGLVTVRDNPESRLSVVGLARAVAGIELVRGEPEYPGKSFHASRGELEFIAAFLAGSDEHPTAPHTFHFVGHQGSPVEGIFVSPIIGS